MSGAFFPPFSMGGGANAKVLGWTGTGGGFGGSQTRKALEGEAGKGNVVWVGGGS